MKRRDCSDLAVDGDHVEAKESGGWTASSCDKKNKRVEGQGTMNEYKRGSGGGRRKQRKVRRDQEPPDGHTDYIVVMSTFSLPVWLCFYFYSVLFCGSIDDLGRAQTCDSLQREVLHVGVEVPIVVVAPGNIVFSVRESSIKRLTVSQ
jgi:hypothetical protein